MTEREILMEQTRDAAREVIRCKAAIKLANRIIKKNCIRIGEIDGYISIYKPKRNNAVNGSDTTGDIFDIRCDISNIEQKEVVK